MSARVSFLQCVMSGEYAAGDYSKFNVWLKYALTMPAPPWVGMKVGFRHGELFVEESIPALARGGSLVGEVAFDCDRAVYHALLGGRVLSVADPFEECKKMLDFGWEMAALPPAALGRGGPSRGVKVEMPGESELRVASEWECRLMAYSGVRFRRVETR